MPEPFLKLLTHLVAPVRLAPHIAPKREGLPVDDCLGVAVAAGGQASELILESPWHDLKFGLALVRVLEQALPGRRSGGARSPLPQLLFVPLRDPAMEYPLLSPNDSPRPDRTSSSHLSDE